MGQTDWFFLFLLGKFHVRGFLKESNFICQVCMHIFLVLLYFNFKCDRHSKKHIILLAYADVTHILEFNLDLSPD